MGLFRTSLTIRHLTDRTRSMNVTDVPVDMGNAATLSWIPAAALETLGVQQQKHRRFESASGLASTRGVGFAIIQSGSFETVDEVVFAEAGDPPLLGVRTLEGFNALVDPSNGRLVAGRPMVAAGNS